jgi:serine/threonine protein kinase/tetratricopeptide (TPR) repeat protein
MDAARWQKLNDLFHAAVGRAADERRAWLDRICAGDHDLIEEVERLVQAYEGTGAVIDTDVATEAAAPLPGERQPGIDALFSGTERFTVRRTLGVGGMGVVYEVHDRTRDEIVALKTLRRADAADIYRLKREFRGLAHVAHPNLVSLYELFVEGTHCFFTMELVNGVNLVDYIRERHAPSLPALPTGGTTMAPVPGAVAGVSRDTSTRATYPSATLTSGSLRADRVRSVFEQLFQGVLELHRRGKLHRDIKPSNVLVTREGRVVILDFGLIKELVPWNPGLRQTIAGTPEYMAPEQALGLESSEASDWYSVGVTLYEALTGLVPFAGSLLDALRLNTESPLRPPSEVAPGIPEDLSSICMGLLARDPTRRLSGADALVGLNSGGRAFSEPSTANVRDRSFVGRGRQLDVLNDAFASVRLGRRAAVYVSGPSGIGKSALVECFLDRLLQREDVTVLTGRCYENESVPYKAIDGVIDNLSHYLASLPRSKAEALMPRDVRALARLFPVMARVDAVATSPRPDQEIPDPFVLRQRAFAALRELLARIADRQPLVMYIDDLHWADADSSALLEDLLRSPGSPAVLMLACFRSEEVASKPFLQALVERRSPDAVGVMLEPMTEDEATELLASLIPGDSPLSDNDRRTIAREAGGNAFIVEQLAHSIGISGTGPRGCTFAEMLTARIRLLPAGAQRFLETLALCGRPIAAELVCEASGLPVAERPLVAVLRDARLIRSSGSSDRIEMYHDRIREGLAAQIVPDAARRMHGLMAQALLARRIDDPEALFEHCRGAGDSHRASIQAGLAANKAAAALAFDRAALFYRHALDLAPHGAARGEWKKGLASALANAGRSVDAAQAYLDAASEADRSQQAELRRHGAEQFLIGGHIDRGLAVIHDAFDDAGMRLPRGPRIALVSLMFRRARLRRRGLAFVERTVDQIAPEELLGIDLCWSALTGLAMSDIIRAADLSARHLSLALDAGEPYRIARALAIEGAMLAGFGARRAMAEALIQQSRAIAERIGHPHAVAFSTFATGMAALMGGQWKKASILYEQALHLLRERCIGVTWELGNTQSFLLGALLYQGEFGEVARRLPMFLAQARECGNLYVETELCTRMNLFWLAVDEPDEGERNAIDVMERWSHRGLYRQHYGYMRACVQTELYRGRADIAWRLMTEHRSALRRMLVLQLQLFRVETSYLRARCALAMAAASPNASTHARARRRFLAMARHEARRIASENMQWANPIAHLVGAAVAYLEGESLLATGLLAEAIDGFDVADMHLYAAVARRRLGTLLGGSHGHELLRQADEWMTSRTIRNPHHMTRLFAPGFDD